MKKLNVLLSLAICCILLLSAIRTYSEYPIAPHEHTAESKEKR